MKRLAILSILATASLFCNILYAQSLNFSISGKIEGLEIGDTLRFMKINLPNWQNTPEFEIIVKENGVFQYKGSHPHSQYYMMQCFPIGKPIAKSELAGLVILIKSGETLIDGVRDDIYLSNLKNEFYDKGFAKVKALEDSLSRERSLILRELNRKQKEKDTVGQVRLADAFNTFYDINANHFKRLKTLRNTYKTSISNEYLAGELCMSASSPLDTLKKGYAKLSEDVKNSYYGTLLKSIIEKIKQSEPGQPALHFTLTTLAGNKISLSDFKDKYLLIYHFGLCPGSMQVDSMVTDLYINNRDKLEVIGLTESMNSLKEMCKNLKAGDSIMGMDLKKIMTNMTSHRWPYEAETTQIDNTYISDLYNIQGLPFFIFISPDGKIVARGYWEAFRTAQATFNISQIK